MPLDQRSLELKALQEDKPPPLYVPAVTELDVVNDLEIFSDPENDDEPVPVPV